MIEPSTLLVESTDSSLKDVCATRLCKTRRFSRCETFCVRRLFLALEQSHKHLPIVLGQSLPVPQSISSVIFSAWSVPFAPIQACDQHQIFSVYFPKCPSQNPPRSFKVDSQSSEVSGTESVISPPVIIRSYFSDCSRNFFRIVSISVGLHICNNVAFRSFVYNTSRISGSIRFSLPNFLCVFSKVALQVNQNNPCLPHVFTRFRSHLWIFHLNVPEFHPRRFFPRWMSSWMFMQIVTGCKVLSPVTLHHLTKTFTWGHQLLDVVHYEGWISAWNSNKL